MSILILGRGLAGSWMARELRKRDVDVLVYDPQTLENSSRVAAGLINPTTGSRPKSTWRSEVLLPFAYAAYRELEEEVGAPLWMPRTIRRVFLTEKDHSLWQNAVERGVGVDWSPLHTPSIDGISLPHGGVEYAGATVDTNALIDVIGDRLAEEGRLLHEAPNLDEFDRVIWCQGWRASTHDLWKWLPFQPVKGEIIDAEIEGPPLTSVYIRGIWIIPEAGEWGMGNGDSTPSHRGTMEPSNRVRIGSTHDWDDMTAEPTEHARRTLVEKAEVILGRVVRVVGQRAAVRPAARSKRPYIGVHPTQEQHAIINGLGAKGSLWAPWAARQLADHLLDGKPLDDEVNIQRWWNE